MKIIKRLYLYIFLTMIIIFVTYNHFSLKMSFNNRTDIQGRKLQDFFKHDFVEKIIYNETTMTAKIQKLPESIIIGVSKCGLL